ncbi:leucine-rich repeat flightless-interacting protein 1 isoform X5 [Silurus meridionalis]|uniref:leucine-rich repeat flightless-interacting protein 1 isoform X5 n=1 Tax=Silurus meridionalis TaxID=175797 RepID=UPI001EEA17B3|nr:leucine-rich repeat flightless-interacting protein 1 isoform X5 [Silurus meridionalis]
MGTQVTGRKRIPNREKVSAEDDALSQIAREAEARLAAKRAARAEAREIRLKELERQQKEISDDEERMSVGSRGSLRPTDYGGFLGSGSRASSRASSARASPVVEERSDFLEKGSRTASTLSAATLASLGGGFSRRGSCDTSISVDTEASIREMKDSLAEAEEKYRKAMVSNAQLDNEKSNLMYQVDTLRDTLMELEELLYETRRECEEKTKEYDRERHAHNILQFQFNEMKETLKQSEELLKEAQQLRSKRESYVSEISDLQETLEWKEKKIAALERQKEYSDIIQDERDALRNEVFRLRDALKKHGISLGSEVTTNGETGNNMTNGPECVESAQDGPAMSADSILERSPEDQAPKMDSTSCMEVAYSEVKRTEDMDSSARASCSFVQIQEYYRIPKTIEYYRGQSVCAENVPDEIIHDSVVAQNNVMLKAEKNANKQNEQKEEPWVEENTSVTEDPESLLSRGTNEELAPSQFIKANNQYKPTNRTGEETAEKMDLPRPTKSYQDPRKAIPSTNVAMTSYGKGYLSSSSEQEFETELKFESGAVKSCFFTIPVEEKGIASFLDSCQEALPLEFEVVRHEESDMARAAQQGETNSAVDDRKHNSTRLKTMSKQDCIVS